MIVIQTFSWNKKPVKILSSKWWSFNLGLNKLTIIYRKVRHASAIQGSIGSDNSLTPVRCRAIISTNAGTLSIGPLGKKTSVKFDIFSEILIEIQTFSSKNIHLKSWSAKLRPFWRGLNMLNMWIADETMGLAIRSFRHTTWLVSSLYLISNFAFDGAKQAQII